LLLFAWVACICGGKSNLNIDITLIKVTQAAVSYHILNRVADMQQARDQHCQEVDLDTSDLETVDKYKQQLRQKEVTFLLLDWIAKQ
jgi:hypothetical protein